MHILLTLAVITCLVTLGEGQGRAFSKEAKEYCLKTFLAINPWLRWDKFLENLAGKDLSCSLRSSQGSLPVGRLTRDKESIGGVVDSTRGDRADADPVSQYIINMLDTWSRDYQFRQPISSGTKFGCAVRPACSGYAVVVCLFSPKYGALPAPRRDDRIPVFADTRARAPSRADSDSRRRGRGDTSDNTRDTRPRVSENRFPPLGSRDPVYDPNSYWPPKQPPAAAAAHVPTPESVLVPLPQNNNDNNNNPTENKDTETDNSIELPQPEKDNIIKNNPPDNKKDIVDIPSIPKSDPAEFTGRGTSVVHKEKDEHEKREQKRRDKVAKAEAREAREKAKAEKAARRLEKQRRREERKRMKQMRELKRQERLRKRRLSRTKHWSISRVQKDDASVVGPKEKNIRKGKGKKDKKKQRKDDPDTSDNPLKQKIIELVTQPNEKSDN